MFNLVAENSGLVLGIAISLYTLYSFLESRILKRRQQYAFLHHLHQEFKYFEGLADHLGRRAQQARDLYSDYYGDGSFPSPSEEKAGLPPEAERTSKWLVQRVKHLIQYQLPIDMDKLPNMLNRSQIDALLELLDARRVYLQVLHTRALDLEAFPRKPGVLFRVAAVSKLNVPEMTKRLHAFSASLGLQRVTSDGGA